MWWLELSWKNAWVPVMLASCLLAQAGGPHSVGETVVVDPLDGGLGWMNIESTEHTAEYLAKVGSGTGDPYSATRLNVAGNWTLDLMDSSGSSSGTIDLILFQSGTLVFGYGKVPSSTAVQAITVSGTIVDDYLTMGIVVLSPPHVFYYQLRNINVGASSASGTFDAVSSAGESPVQGTFSASKEEEARFLS